MTLQLKDVQAAAARVRHLRFGDDGKDYFWIQDLSPRMVCAEETGRSTCVGDSGSPLLSKV